MIAIYDINGNKRFETLVNEGSKRTFKLMGDDNVTLKFSVAEPIYFQLGDYCDIDGFGRFELIEPYYPQFNNETGGYDYELRLDAQYRKWKNKILKFLPEFGGYECAWTLTATAYTFMTQVLSNINALINEKRIVRPNNLLLGTQSAFKGTITGGNNFVKRFEVESGLADRVKGKEVTFSFRYKYSGVNTVGITTHNHRLVLQFMVEYEDGTEGYPQSVVMIPVGETSASSQGLHVGTVTMPANTKEVKCGYVGAAWNTGDYEIWDCKAEIGTNPAPVWTPAESESNQQNTVHVNVENRNYLFNGISDWEVRLRGEVDQSAKTLQFDQTSILDALTMIAEKFEVEWWIEGNIIYLGKCDQTNEDYVDLELGVNVSDMTRSNSKEEYVTRVIPFGSTRNISPRYRKELVFDVKEVESTDSGMRIVDTARLLSRDCFEETEDYKSEKHLKTATFKRSAKLTASAEKSAAKTIIFSCNESIANLRPSNWYLDFSSFHPRITFSNKKGKEEIKTYNLTIAVYKGSDRSSVYNHSETFNIPELDKETVIDNSKFKEKDFTSSAASESVLIDIELSVNLPKNSSIDVEIFLDDPVYLSDGLEYASVSGLILEQIDLKGNTVQTIEGCVYNPGAAHTWKERNWIQLPKGKTLSIGDRFRITNIISSKVKSSYFSSKYALYDNLSTVVRNGIIADRLMLPENYGNFVDWVDSENSNDIFLPMERGVEDVVIFEDIYPRAECTVTQVTEARRNESVQNDDGTTTDRSFTAYIIKDDFFTKEHKFSRDYILNGKTLEVTFGDVYRYTELDKEKGRIPAGKSIGDPVNSEAGRLNGQTFEVAFTRDEDGSAFWEIVRNNDTFIPNEIIHPQVGDTFVLTGFDVQAVNDLYVKEAEKELLEKTRLYMKKHNTDTSTYDCTMMPDVMRNGLVLGVGKRVNLINEAYIKTHHEKDSDGNVILDAEGNPRRWGRKSRVIGFEIPLDIPYDNPVYTIGEKAEYSKFGAIEDRLDALNFAMNNQGTVINGISSAVNGGNVVTNQGGSAGTSIYAIGTTDPTQPSETNVFSALRSKLEFASKRTKEYISYLWTFAKGLWIGDFNSGSSGAEINADGDAELNSLNVRNESALQKGLTVGTRGFVEDLIGGRFWEDDNGKVHLVTDYVNVREKFTAKEIEIQEETHVGGCQIISPAGMRCERVVWLDSNGDKTESLSDTAAFMCFFGAEDSDGVRIYNQFRVNDLAKCETVNLSADGKNLSNRKYWREVIECGYVSEGDKFYSEEFGYEGFITLSNVAGKMKDGVNDTPLPGDAIITVGNRNDEQRSNLIVLASFGSGSPYIYQYKGVHDFELTPDNRKIEISPNGNKFTGQFIIENGSSETSIDQYIEGNSNLNSYHLELSNPSAVVSCDSNGVCTGTMPQSNIKVYKGAVEDTGWSYTYSAQGCECSMSGGIITLTSLTTETASILITARKSGKPTLTKVMTVAKVKSGADGQSGSNYAPNLVARTAPYNGKSLDSDQFTDGCKATSGISLSDTKKSFGANGEITRRIDLATGIITEAGTYSVMCWCKKVSGEGSLRVEVNDKNIFYANPASNGEWQQFKGTAYVDTYIGEYGFVDFHAKAGSEWVVSDIVCVRSASAPDDWIPTAEEMLGKDGRGVSKVEEYYAVTSNATAPTSWGSANPATVPQPTAQNPYLWNQEITTYTDGTTSDTKPHIVAVFGASGADGATITAVTDYYQLGTSGTTAPTGTWLTAPPTPSKEQPWLWNYEQVTYSKGNPTETKKRVIAHYGADGADGKDGTDGTNGEDYKHNMLRDSDVLLDANAYGLGSYEYDVKPTKGKAYTLTVCYKCANGGSINTCIDGDMAGVVPFLESSTEAVQVIPISSDASNRDSFRRVSFWLKNADGNNATANPKGASYVKWAVLTEGEGEGVTEWRPALSEICPPYTDNLLLGTADRQTLDPTKGADAAKHLAWHYFSRVEGMAETISGGRVTISFRYRYTGVQTSSAARSITVGLSLKTQGSSTVDSWPLVQVELDADKSGISGEGFAHGTVSIPALGSIDSAWARVMALAGSFEVWDVKMELGRNENPAWSSAQEERIGENAVTYEIDPSCELIYKSMDGKSARPDKIYCSVYKTDGNNPREEITPDPQKGLTLTYTKYYLTTPAGTNEAKVTAGEGGLYTSLGVDVSYSGLEYIIFYLYDESSKLLVSKTVPAIVDTVEMQSTYNTKFETTDKKISLNASKVTEIVSGVGRNLLLRTNQGTANWTYYTDSSVKATLSANANWVRFKNSTRSTGAATEHFCYSLRPKFFSPGNKYLVSFIIRCTDENNNATGIKLYSRISEPNGDSVLTDKVVCMAAEGGQTVIESTSYIRMYALLTCQMPGNSSGKQKLIIGVDDGYRDRFLNLEIRDLKLEVADSVNQITDYSPAPEDNLNYSYSLLQSSIDVSAEGIRSSVKKQYDTVTEYASTIDQKADKISMTVDKTIGFVNLVPASNWRGVSGSASAESSISAKDGKLSITAPQNTNSRYLKSSIFRLASTTTYRICAKYEWTKANGNPTISTKIYHGSSATLITEQSTTSKWNDNGAEVDFIFTTGEFTDGFVDDAYIQFFVTTAKEQTVHFSEIRLTKGLEKHTYAEGSVGLLATGIDISRGEIIATTDNFLVRNREGKTSFAINSEGLIRAECIDVDNIIARRVVAGEPSGQRIEISPDSKSMTVYEKTDDGVVKRATFSGQVIEDPMASILPTISDINPKISFNSSNENSSTYSLFKVNTTSSDVSYGLHMSLKGTVTLFGVFLYQLENPGSEEAVTGPVQEDSYDHEIERFYGFPTVYIDVWAEDNETGTVLGKDTSVITSVKSLSSYENVSVSMMVAVPTATRGVTFKCSIRGIQKTNSRKQSSSYGISLVADSPTSLSGKDGFSADYFGNGLVLKTGPDQGTAIFKSKDHGMVNYSVNGNNGFKLDNRWIWRRIMGKWCTEPIIILSCYLVCNSTSWSLNSSKYLGSSANAPTASRTTTGVGTLSCPDWESLAVSLDITDISKYVTVQITPIGNTPVIFTATASSKSISIRLFNTSGKATDSGSAYVTAFLMPGLIEN